EWADSNSTNDGLGGADLDPGSGANLLQRLHVAERLGENITWARQPAFVALGNWRAAEANGDGGAFRPIGDLARRHHGAGTGLAFHPHRHVEIDLLAPGQRLGVEWQRRRYRPPRPRLEQCS